MTPQLLHGVLANVHFPNLPNKKANNKNRKTKKKKTSFDIKSTTTLESVRAWKKLLSQFWPKLRHLLSQKTVTSPTDFFFFCSEIDLNRVATGDN